MKTLVIINGVTGAIGTACLARFSREQNTTVIGLSRKALGAESFCENGFLVDSTIICSIGDKIDAEHCLSFVQKIKIANYNKVIYVHSVGVYPFELDREGNIHVSHDDDGDGIDDRVMELTYIAFFSMVNALKITGLPVSSILFGSVADKYSPSVHTSWWRVMNRVREKMNELFEVHGSLSFFILNISSVICPHEILTRPFVFRNTNADARFWLMPHEVAEKVHMLTFSNMSGVVDDDLFHKSNYWDKDYFTDAKFTERKKQELGIK